MLIHLGEGVEALIEPSGAEENVTVLEGLLRKAGLAGPIISNERAVIFPVESIDLVCCGDGAVGYRYDYSRQGNRCLTEGRA